MKYIIKYTEGNDKLYLGYLYNMLDNHHAFLQGPGTKYKNDAVQHLLSLMRKWKKLYSKEYICAFNQVKDIHIIPYISC